MAGMVRILLVAAVMVSTTVSVEAMDTSANPIRKVVNLLKGMVSKVEADGAKAEELYDKFMCYCSTAGDSLKGQIAASDAKVPAVASSIKEAEAQTVTLKAELKQAQVDRSDAKAAMAQATALRTKEASTFAEQKSMYDTNIAAIGKSVGALEKGMLGSFLQTSVAKAVQRMALDSQDMEQQDRKDLLAFLSGQQAEDAPSTGEVIGILKQMGDTMAKDLADITGTEKGSVSAYDELMTAKEKEVEVLSASIEAKMGQIGELGVSTVEMKNDLTETEASLIEDKQFLADLGKSCSTKTAEYTEEKKTRGEELVALSETIKILDDDDALELFKKTLPSASSFVQMKVTANAMRERALAALRGVRRTKYLDRTRMDFISLALHGKAIGFEKVIGMIDEMVSTLKKEQLDDDHKKEYCDKQFDLAEDKKKGLERAISDEGTAIADTEESIATLTAEIKALEDGIKALDKDVAAAAEQRKEEATAYSELMASDSAAKELLGFAKNRLNKFYNPKLYKPAPKRVLSDEDSIVVSMGGTLAPTQPPGGISGTGITVFAEISAHERRLQRKDLPQPPVSFAAYAQKSAGSAGVIAMMDLLIKDLDKELTEAETTETDAQADYAAMVKDAAEKRAADSEALTEKKAALADAEATLESHKDAKSSGEKELMSVEGYISTLHAECDWLIKYFDVRKTARDEEIGGLGNAKAVLSGADYSLLETQRTRSFLGRK
jgi:chromosome segregation ATPase